MPLKFLPQFPRPAEQPRAADEHDRLLHAFRRPYREPGLGLMVQSSTLVFAYWEIPPELRREFGPSPRLELEDLSGGERQVVSLEHPHELGDYWFHVRPDHTYRAVMVSGGDHHHLESEPVRTPRDHPSHHWATDEAAVWVTLEELSARSRKSFIERYLSLLDLMGLRWRPEASGLPPSSLEGIPWPPPPGVPTSGAFGPGAFDFPPPWTGLQPSSLEFGVSSWFGRPPFSDAFSPGPGREGWR
jgi:hypothetical protein